MSTKSSMIRGTVVPICFVVSFWRSIDKPANSKIRSPSSTAFVRFEAILCLGPLISRYALGFSPATCCTLFTSCPYSVLRRLNVFSEMGDNTEIDPLNVPQRQKCLRLYSNPLSVFSICGNRTMVCTWDPTWKSPRRISFWPPKDCKSVACVYC